MNDYILQLETFMKPLPKLLQFAEVCLGPYYVEFKQALDDFQTLNISEFNGKYPDFETICSDLEEMNEKDIKSTDWSPILLFFYAESKELMSRVDWSGEDETGEVAEAVKRILNARNTPGFEWDTEKFMASRDWNTIGRGDFIPILFKAIDAELREIDYRLTIFFMGDDSYPFTVLSTADFNKVHRLSWSFYAVQGVDTLGEYRPMGGIFQNRVRAVVQFFRRFTG